MFLAMLTLLCAAPGQTVGTALENASPWQQQAPQPAGETLLASAFSFSLSCAHSPSLACAHAHSHGSHPAKTKTGESASLQSRLSEAAWVARQFLMSLLREDWDALLELAAFPFWLESKAHASPEALRETWAKQLSQKRLDAYAIGGIEVLTLEQMKARFGPPPERLHKLLQGRNLPLFAVANLSGKAVVLLLQVPSSSSGLKVVGFHD